MARLTFDDETNVLTYQVTVHGISGGAVTASHIYQAAAGSNGPVIIALSLEPFTSVHGSATLDDDQVEALMAGDYYINVHSSNNPGGFARCQLSVPVVAVVTPPSTGDGGLAAKWVNFLAGGCGLGRTSGFDIRNCAGRRGNSPQDLIRRIRRTLKIREEGLPSSLIGLSVK